MTNSKKPTTTQVEKTLTEKVDQMFSGIPESPQLPPTMAELYDMLEKSDQAFKVKHTAAMETINEVNSRLRALCFKEEYWLESMPLDTENKHYTFSAGMSPRFIRTETQLGWGRSNKQWALMLRNVTADGEFHHRPATETWGRDTMRVWVGLRYFLDGYNQFIEHNLRSVNRLVVSEMLEDA